MTEPLRVGTPAICPSMQEQSAAGHGPRTPLLPAHGDEYDDRRLQQPAQCKDDDLAE